MKSMSEYPYAASPSQVLSIQSGEKTQLRVKFPEEPWQDKPEDRRDPNEWHISTPGKSRLAGWTSNWRGYRLVGQKEGFDREEYVPKDRWLVEICPLGVVGDRLWVQESWVSHAKTKQVVGYQVDGCKKTDPWHRLRGAYNMPRSAARTILEITEVSVQRLQEITEADAVAEGIYRNQEGRGSGWRYAEDAPTYGYATSAYRELWNSRNVMGQWDENPLVWKVGFKLLSGVRAEG
jgi:hypothetical protein